uniref:Cytochrome P450 3A n=1 Tax=Anolis carolinensis TaxID=28377 RepID=A0A803TRT6_ANOCA
MIQMLPTNCYIMTNYRITKVLFFFFLLALRLFDGRQPVIAILDPAIIKIILVKHFYTHFTNRRDFGLNGELDTSIAITRDEHWKRIRTVLSPNFTSGRLKEMLPIINHYGKILVESAQKKVENGEAIDLKSFFGGYSMDVTTSTSFSINVDSINNPNDPFVMHIKTFLKFDTFDPVILLVGRRPLYFDLPSFLILLLLLLLFSTSSSPHVFPSFPLHLHFYLHHLHHFYLHHLHAHLHLHQLHLDFPFSSQELHWRRGQSISFLSI